jgi:spore germination protein KC
MPAKRIRLTVLIILIILTAAGCWDARDIEDKDIAITVAVDRTAEGDHAFYVKVASISAGGESGTQNKTDTKSRLVTGMGSSYIEARENIDRSADNPIFLGAVQTIILTESLAYSGIEDYMLRVRQTPEYRKTLDVVVTPTEPVTLMNYEPENEQTAGFAIESLIKSLVDSGQTFDFSLGDLLGIIASRNKCFLLHNVALKDSITVIGYSIFDNGICTGFIPIEESKGVLFLKADAPQPYYNIYFSAGSAAIRVRSAAKDIRPYYNDGKISFDLSFDISAQVLSLSSNIKISEQTRQEIESELEAKVLDDLSKAIMTSQSSGCDYLDFHTFFRIRYPEEANNMDWKEEYKSAAFNISVSAKLDLVSTVNYSE